MGDCEDMKSRPGKWDPKGRAHWDAWYQLKGEMTKDEAMDAYIRKVQDKWLHSE